MMKTKRLGRMCVIGFLLFVFHCGRWFGVSYVCPFRRENYLFHEITVKNRNKTQTRILDNLLFLALSSIIQCLFQLSLWKYIQILQICV
eukprot:UN13793